MACVNEVKVGWQMSCQSDVYFTGLIWLIHHVYGYWETGLIRNRHTKL